MDSAAKAPLSQPQTSSHSAGPGGRQRPPSPLALLQMHSALASRPQSRPAPHSQLAVSTAISLDNLRPLRATARQGATADPAGDQHHHHKHKQPRAHSVQSHKPRRPQIRLGPSCKPPPGSPGLTGSSRRAGTTGALPKGLQSPGRNPQSPGRNPQSPGGSLQSLGGSPQHRASQTTMLQALPGGQQTKQQLR